MATRDGGTSWEPQKSGTEQTLKSVHFAGADVGWAVGGNGTILATRAAEFGGQRSRAAEYLAAIRRLVDMSTKRAGPDEWQSYFSSLERTEGYPCGAQNDPSAGFPG